MKPKPRYQRGDRIGRRYQVHQALMGGMGEVYLCLDLETIQPVALKTFQQRYLTNPKLRQLFNREVATWVALEKHPNVVRCFYMDILDNQPFMFLEWIAGDESRGTDLRSWLRRGPLDLRLALDFTIDICRGLIHAQEKQPGIVHRDLKPDNILVAQGRLAKITDFGLAKIVQEAELEITDAEGETDGRQSLLGQGGIVGTPPYMAPEQWRGEALDARADIYAVGCTLYELLAGNPPFRASTLDELRWQHLEADVPKLTNGESLPAALDTLLTRCLAKRRQERLSSVGELLQQLSIVYCKRFSEPPKAVAADKDFTVSDYCNRAKTYELLQLHDRALSDYTQATQLDPNDARPYSDRGVLYDNLMCYKDALADHDRAVFLDPTDALAYFNRGVTLQRIQRYEEALKDYTRSIELDSADALAYVNRGGACLGLERYDDALEDFTKAIGVDPHLAIAYFNRAGVYKKLRYYEKALTDYTQTIEFDPDFALAYYERGLIFGQLQRHSEAIVEFDYVIGLDPTATAAYFNRGIAHANLQCYDEALSDFTRATELDPNLVQAYLFRGVIYESLKRYTEALADYTRAIQLGTTNASIYSKRGAIYLRLKLYNEALADYKQATEIDPNLAQAFFIRGVIYESLQRHDEALAEYTEAIKVDPYGVEAHFNRGVLYQQMQRYNEALTDYTHAIQLDSTDARICSNRGATYYALQRYAEALADLNQAIQLDPNFAPAYLNIGAVLRALEAPMLALPYFEKAGQLGLPQGAQHAKLIMQTLEAAALSQGDPVPFALGAFSRASSLEQMKQAVTRFPFMVDSGFIAALVQIIVKQAPQELQPAFEQRLAWLRQIANEQK